jgi:hypothetical protein
MLVHARVVEGRLRNYRLLDVQIHVAVDTISWCKMLHLALLSMRTRVAQIAWRCSYLGCRKETSALPS